MGIFEWLGLVSKARFETLQRSHDELAKKVQALIEEIEEIRKQVSGLAERTDRLRKEVEGLRKRKTLEVSEVKGIGVKKAERLREVGVHSVEELAAMPPEVLTEKIGISINRAKRWVKRAAETMEKS